MSEPRTTLRGVEAMASDVLILARELGLTDPGEEWYIERGSTTKGTKWKLYATVGGKRKIPELRFTGHNNYIGSTARQARDFLEHIWDALNYVQMMQEKR
jgi:hypothetical protein